MQKIKIYFLKSLKKLKLLPHFNLVFSKKLNRIDVKIPILGEIGLTNMVLKKEWLDLLIEEFALPQSSKTFVDVGANIGQTMLRLKTIYPESDYLGFEPNSTCASYVQKLIKTNRFKNCTIHNAGLSTEIGILQLEKDSDTDSRASVVSNFRPNFFSTKESVLVLDYQSFYLDKEVNFIKIDVEGAEYEVLKGMEKAIKKHRPVITCEVLDAHNASVFDFAQDRATQLCTMLQSWNYNIIRLQTESSTIANYKKIETIKLIQWSQKSLAFNDYLFYPTEMEEEVIKKLKKITV